MGPLLPSVRDTPSVGFPLRRAGGPIAARVPNSEIISQKALLRI